MTHSRSVSSIIGLAAAVLAIVAFSPVGLLQAVAQSGVAKASPPDLSGMWARPLRPGPRAGYENPGLSITNETPSMTPWAAEKFRKIQEGPKRYQFDRGNMNWDPSDWHCLPWGPTRPYTKVDQSFEIVQTPKVIYILFETNREVRRIYMDGRPHPAGWPFKWMGHSTGKFEGDTLVVDTTGLSELTWIDTMGHLQSDEMHIVERFRRVEPDTLQIEFTFNDPKAYTKPWNGKRVFELMKGERAEILPYIACEEHLLEHHVPKLLRGDEER